MAKLTSLKPSLKTLSHRLGTIEPSTRQEAEAKRLRDRDKTQPWRQWYSTGRWQKLRLAMWLRDAFVCQQTGVLCIGKHPVPNSPVADHKTPHRGDPILFWDEANIQTASKAYHDSQKQREERGQW